MFFTLLKILYMGFGLFVSPLIVHNTFTFSLYLFEDDIHIF